ncbi:unnamed protein product [Ceratitis capitata]|uniref:(Mediterranean fruit fly) hypothetical protein n=1 Tax=Ceratitis capitata TaxID=7213 RepID=A0A811VAX9_CERCA|nr:unnamed protein product [Ceratitis capitata]
MANERKCCVPKCGRTSHKNPELRFFGIPKDPELRPKWMENLKIKRLYYKITYVCSIHFEDEARNKHRLKKNAIPTLHLGYDGLVPHKFIKHYVAQRKCCIESCKIQHMIKGVKTYSFPEGKNERLAWARACNLPLPLPQKDIYLCERHFERKYKSKMRLRPGAFPKFFLRGEDDEDIEQKNAESNASDADPSNEESNASDAQQSIEESNASDAEQSNEESNASDSEQSNESRIVPDVEVYSMDYKSDLFTTQESSMDFNQDLPVKFTYPVDMEEDDSNFNTIEKSEDIELPSQEEHMQSLNIQRESIRKRDGKRQAQGVSNDVLPVKLICSRIVQEIKVTTSAKRRHKI